jgi:cytochrome c oxidase assembly protein subunit 15
MMTNVPAAQSALYDFAPFARMALAALALAAAPLSWVWLRHRAGAPGRRLHALSVLTLFLTFDLVLFGAYTRLSDSGLGCPDWPGCYGHASPLGAGDAIAAAQAALPSGPVTHGKAWVEMVHRYLASAVGVLVGVIAAARWLAQRRGRPGGELRWWALAAFAWVCVQGAFGALTVTMKLYPAVVTAHLLGGMALLALLAAQLRPVDAAADAPAPPAVSSPSLRLGVWAVGALAVVQIALGGWVSTNYAVLACSDFPLCQGQWWPPMDFGHAFTLRRELGRDGAGGWLPFAALTAIHQVHRLMAVVVLAALVLLAWRLMAAGGSQPDLRRRAAALAAVAAWQLASGVSNVVLGWPVVAAVAHTGGAAALVVVLATLAVRLRGAARRHGVRSAAGGSLPLHAAS